MEETENQFNAVNKIINDIENYCDILPVNEIEDARIDWPINSEALRRVFDPINLARTENLILLSDDVNFRQYAAHWG